MSDAPNIPTVLKSVFEGIWAHSNLESTFSLNMSGEECSGSLDFQLSNMKLLRSFLYEWYFRSMTLKTIFENSAVQSTEHPFGWICSLAVSSNTRVK